MNVVLTICSANYLAHAKVLGDSLAESNPDYKFVIGLVDSVPAGTNCAGWLFYEVVPVLDLGIQEFSAMAEKYDIVELNTAVKPFYVEFLFQRDPAVETVIYLDPDILVLGSFLKLTTRLRDNNIILTPHSCTSGETASNLHYEIGMLCTGIYNLGFIAIARSQTTFSFLKWWQKRLIDHCYYRPGSGVFVDQLWITLVPLYFENVYVEKDPGYNMCYWNLFERRLVLKEKKYFVNESHELIFYHFSSYNPLKPNATTGRSAQQIITFKERPDIQLLYEDYRKQLLESGYEAARSVKYAFEHEEQRIPTRIVKANIEYAAIRILNAMPKASRVALRKISGFIAANCRN